MTASLEWLRATPLTELTPQERGIVFDAWTHLHDELVPACKGIARLMLESGAVEQAIGLLAASQELRARLDVLPEVLELGKNG